jgi:hypothetical protein
MTEALRIERVEDYTDRMELGPHLLRLESVEIEVGLDERVRKGIEDVPSLPPLPMQLIEKYVEVAMRHATLKQRPEGRVATISGFHGVEARGHTEEEALEGLKEVLWEWTLQKIERREGGLPVIEEIDLNVLSMRGERTP